MELAATAGLKLDPWQQFALRNALGERPDGTWSAFEVALQVPRQNGKGSILEAYELANLYLFDAKLILHSAHLFPTAQEAFRRLRDLIDGSHSLRRRVKRISSAHGEEGIELTNGQRIRFMARTVSGAGRGFSPDRLVLDEAFRLPLDAVAALLPALSAQRNAQIFYASSTGYSYSEVLWELTKRGRAGGDRSLCYLEWSADPLSDPQERQQWAKSNPALGYRISEETIERELTSMSEDAFKRERLGLWDETAAATVIDLLQWASLADPDSSAKDPLTYGLAVSPDRAWSSIAVCGERADGLTHVDVGYHRRGTAGLLDKCVDLDDRHGPALFVVDGHGPGASLISEMRDAGLDVLVASLQDVTQGFGHLIDMIANGELRHVGDADLNEAVAATKKRSVGDGAFAPGRTASGEDITPVEAMNLAAWGHRDQMQGAPNVW